jgi:CheY-like chemotaxis protein
MRILVIDDHAPTRLALTRLLQQANHQVTTAANVAEARDSMESDSFQLLICDHRLPDGDGGDLAQVAHDRGAKFILTSATPATGVGCDACLLKPLSIDAVEQAIAGVLALMQTTA